jgi:hypothetical protein
VGVYVSVNTVLPLFSVDGSSARWYTVGTPTTRSPPVSFGGVNLN